MDEFFKIRWTDNRWVPAGTPLNPFNLRMPTGTWQVFGDMPGGRELKLRLPNGTWKKVSRAGLDVSPGVYGRVTDTDGMPLKRKLVLVQGISEDDEFVTNGALTDENGEYVIAGLPLGMYSVMLRLPTVFYNQPIVQTPATLTASKPRKLIDFLVSRLFVNLSYSIPLSLDGYYSSPGWTARKYTMIENERDGPQPDDRIPQMSGAPSTILNAMTFSAMGWNGDELNNYMRWKQEETSWMLLPPIPLLRTAALDTMSQINGYWGYEDFAEPRLEYIDVSFDLWGYSVIKRQAPWMNFYEHGTTTIGLNEHMDTGGLYLLGEEFPDTFITGQWVPETRAIDSLTDQRVAPARTVALGATRDRFFERGTAGTPLWTGPLNNLGASIHGLSRPPVTVTRRLPADTNVAEEMYHMWVDSLPDPQFIDKNVAGHTIDSRMYADIHVDFHYRFW